MDSGDIGGISLSEVNAKTIERAAKVVKIVAVEVAFSLFSCTGPLFNLFSVSRKIMLSMWAGGRNIAHALGGARSHLTLGHICEQGHIEN